MIKIEFRIRFQACYKAAQEDGKTPGLTVVAAL